MITTIIILALIAAAIIAVAMFTDLGYEEPEICFMGVLVTLATAGGLLLYGVVTAYNLSYANVDRDSITESVNQCRDVPEFHCAGVIETAIAFNRDLAYWKAQAERDGFFSAIVPDSLIDVRPVVLPKRGN